VLCDEPRVRAQFSAVRSKALEKLRRPSKVWKVLWYVPFNLCAVAALTMEHAPARLALQLTTLAACVVVIVHFRPFTPRMAPIGMGLGTLHYVVGVANTGGLASPLLLAGLPMLAMAGIVLEHRRHRTIFTALVAFSFLLLSAGRSAVVFTPKLLFAADGATLTHCVFAGITSIMATLALIHIGAGITRAYTEVVYDLAARQEEICEEGEDLARSLEGMAARVAHEVKNPLASIKALSSLEAKRAADPQTAERLGVIALEADRLRDVVDGFLSFSKQASSLKLGEVKPHDVAHEIAVLLEGRTAETGVAVEPCGDDALSIVADGRKLRQALLNLVLNAVQASPAGTSVRIAVARRCDDTARIQVIDRGEGMSPDVLERIRRPHYSTRQGGSGLGLAVARSIVEQHGGTLELTSKKGAGTTATITLPLETREVVTSMQWLASS
jgi:signal transduction histidine kinase